MSAEPHFDQREDLHAEEIRKMNLETRLAKIDRAFGVLQYQHKDPHYVALQKELSREIVVLEALKRLDQTIDRLTHMADLHLDSVIQEYTARVERAQLRVNRRGGELGHQSEQGKEQS